MNSGGTPLLSVRAEARQLVAPDYAELDGQIEHTAGSKAEAVRSVTGSRPPRRHRAPASGPQRGVRGGRPEPACDPGADSRPAGAHRDHRGPLPHHRRVPARRLRPYPPISLEVFGPFTGWWPHSRGGHASPGTAGDTPRPGRTRTPG